MPDNRVMRSDGHAPGAARLLLRPPSVASGVASLPDIAGATAEIRGLTQLGGDVVACWSSQPSLL
jgi:hypothetical protein